MSAFLAGRSWRAGVVVLGSVILFVLAVRATGAQDQPADPAHAMAAEVDLQAHCESLVGRLPPGAPGVRRLSARIERAVMLPGRPWGILGAQWDARTSTLAILEGQESRLIILDTLGSIVMAVGRAGGGPAEFRFSPVYFGSRQKF